MKKSLIVLILAGLTMFLGGCVSGGNNVRGTGDVVTRIMDVEDFSAIDISGSYIVVYRQAQTTALTVVMQENLFDYLQVETRGDTLQIGSRRGFDTSTANRPRLYIYAPNLTAASFSGAANATDWDTLEGEGFSLNISGAGNVGIGLDVEQLDISVSGAGDITLWGSADDININGSGALTISASDLEISGGRVDISGAGNVTLSSLTNVEVNTSGVARVRAAN